MKVKKLVACLAVCFAVCSVVLGAGELVTVIFRDVLASETSSVTIDPFNKGYIGSIIFHFAGTTTDSVSINVVKSGTTNIVFTGLVSNAVDGVWLPEGKIWLEIGNTLQVVNSSTTTAMKAWIAIEN